VFNQPQSTSSDKGHVHSYHSNINLKHVGVGNLLSPTEKEKSLSNTKLKINNIININNNLSNNEGPKTSERDRDKNNTSTAVKIDEKTLIQHNNFLSNYNENKDKSNSTSNLIEDSKLRSSLLKGNDILKRNNMSNMTNVTNALEDKVN